MNNCVLLVRNGEPSIVNTDKFIDLFTVHRLLELRVPMPELKIDYYRNHFTWHDQIIVFDSTVPKEHKNVSAYTRLGDVIYGDFVVCRHGKNLSSEYWKFDLRALTSKEMAIVVCNQLKFKDGMKHELG